MLCELILAACVLAAGGEPGATLQQEATPLYVLARETSAAMRREASAAPGERADAIRGLCELHRTLLTDSRYEQVDKLKDLRGRIYSRLRRVQLELKRESAEAEPAGKAEPREATLLAAAEKSAEQDRMALAAADSLASSMAILDVSIGGPNALVAHGGRAVPDNGQALVDLIERTINPAFWDTNGGTGSIVYYQPLQCLVVRASGDVHQRLGGLVGGLRAAGR